MFDRLPALLLVLVPPAPPGGRVGLRHVGQEREALLHRRLDDLPRALGGAAPHLQLLLDGVLRVPRGYVDLENGLEEVFPDRDDLVDAVKVAKDIPSLPGLDPELSSALLALKDYFGK